MLNVKEKENLCSHCDHGEVCLYKKDYSDILKVVENTITKNRHDFISMIDISCKYYENRQEIHR